MKTTNLAHRFINAKCVFLDRDGVINKKLPENQYLIRWSDFHLLPRVTEAIARLNTLGLRVILVTNQRGIALGYCTEEEVEFIHAQLEKVLATAGARLDAIYYCPHDINQCDCRKPLPGLFRKAFCDFPECDPQNSVIIGDSLSDIEAGVNLGMRTIFVEGPIATGKEGSVKAAALATITAVSLMDAVERCFER